LLGLGAVILEGGVEAGLFSARAIDTSVITNRNALISDRSLFIRLTSF
jgi:hypothetical protein